MAHSWQVIQGPPSTFAPVLLDLDSSPLSIQKDTSVSPPQLQRSTTRSLGDGEIETRASYMDRVLKLDLKLASGVAAETQASTLQTLARLLDQPDGLWLKWHDEGMTQPLFFRTRRASFDVLDEVLSATPIRNLRVELSAEPFAYGLPESGSVTVTNDPTSGTNKMAVKWATAVGAVKGDVATPLQLQFPTADAAHRILLASAALLPSEPPTPLAYDYFDRANSTTTLGTAPLGVAWTTLNSSTWGIDTNQAYVQTQAGGSTYSIAYQETGRADGIVEVTIGTMQANGFAGLLIRNGGTGSTGFALQNNGLWNVAGGQVGVNFNDGVGAVSFVSGDRCRVRMSGNNIKVFRQAGAVGPWVQVFNVDTATYNTNTKHGLNTFGATPLTTRFNDFSFTPLTAELAATPYWKAVTSETIKASPVTDWAITDQADANAIAATTRRMNHSVDTVSNYTDTPFQDPLLRWLGVPQGEYRAFLRVAAGTGAPPMINLQNGSAHNAATASPGTVRAWKSFGEQPVAMPYAGPPPDIEFGIAGRLVGKPWTLQAEAQDDAGAPAIGSVDLDGLILIPTKRPGLISRFLTLAFSSSHTSKVVTVDGINNDQVYATGRSAGAPLIDQFLAPTEQRGAPPVLVPGADNVLYFMTNLEGASADAKSTTTVLQWTYYPRYLSADRPSAS